MPPGPPPLSETTPVSASCLAACDSTQLTLFGFQLPHLKGLVELHHRPLLTPASAPAPALAPWSLKRVSTLSCRQGCLGGREPCFPLGAVTCTASQGQEEGPEGTPHSQHTGQSLPGVTHTLSTAASVDKAQVTQGLGLTQ